MRRTLTRNELCDLASRHCAGTLDAGRAQRLADALRDDPQVRRWFIEYMDLHAALTWNGTSAAELDGARLACLPRPAPQRGRAWNKHWATPKRIALIVATVAVCAFLGIMAYTPATIFHAVGWRTRPEKVIGANLSAAIDCRWASAKELPVGAPLEVGQQLTLIEGAAEITFSGGAVVTLTGPAKLTIDSANSGTLNEGKLAAVVPQMARGFTIGTPGSTIIDLGTEFGVLVPPRDEVSGRPLGKEELHVFAGEVEVDFRNPNAKPRRLTTGEAVRFASRPDEQTEVAAIEQLAASQRTRFPQQIDTKTALTVSAPLPPDRHPPVTRGLVLWLAADGAVHCTSAGGVARWEDMLTGDNREAHPAVQAFAQRRPQWKAEAINGLPAIYFDGDDYLALPGANKLGISGVAYEMFVVARTSSSAAQFLIAGGREEFELHINGAAGETGARFIPTGHFDGRGASDVGQQGDFSDGRPHLFVARVVPANEFRGVLTVDSQVSDDPTDDDARGYSDIGLRLGMRFSGELGLQGEIAEVLVYGQSLRDAERRAACLYLSQKYNIPLSQD